MIVPGPKKLAGLTLLAIPVFSFFLFLILRHTSTPSTPHQQDVIFLDAERNMFSFKENSITTPYGTFKVSEQVIFDLIQSAAFQRIRYVHQYGVMKWIRNAPEYSRYAHCLGVWAILRRFNAPLNEQIAGLLHDVSHTVFSHLGDHIFNHHSSTHSYQDEIHEWFLKKYCIDKIVSNHGIELRDVLHKSAQYTMLERDLPDLCADRIEYNLRGGLIAGLIKESEIEEILSAMRFEDDRWFFVDQAAAVKLAKIPLYLTVHEWGSPANHLVYAWIAKAIRRALELQMVTFDEIHFSTDDLIWERLVTASDPIIKKYMNKAFHHREFFNLTQDHKKADSVIKTKFRGVNPWIYSEGEFKRLTEVNTEFCQSYKEVQEQVLQGWAIKYIPGFNPELQ